MIEFQKKSLDIDNAFYENACNLEAVQLQLSDSSVEHDH